MIASKVSVNCSVNVLSWVLAGDAPNLRIAFVPHNDYLVTLFAKSKGATTILACRNLYPGHESS
jgi:hypothetical protein